MMKYYFSFVFYLFIHVGSSYGTECNPNPPQGSISSSCEYTTTGNYIMEIGESLTLENGVTLIINVNTEFDVRFGGVLTVKDGATLRVNGNSNFRVGSSINIENGGRFEVVGNITSPPFLLVPGGTGSSVINNGTIVASGSIDFGAADVTDNGSIGVDPDLPVELTYFKANQERNNVKLEWQTASEQNASHFDIQRSSDRKNWITLERQEAAGNSQTSINYDYIDESPLNIGYYRLLQVDFDGASEIFGPIQIVQNGTEIPLELVIMPNQLSSGEPMQFGISGLTEGLDVNIQVFNNFGALVYQEVLSKVSSKSLLKKMEFSRQLGTGIYYVVLSSGKKQVKEKLVIQ